MAWANSGQNERAITEFSQSLKLDPQNFNVVKNRARCWERTANPAKAIDDYAARDKIDPTDADVCRRLGQILTSDGLNEIDPKKIVLLAMDLSDSKAGSQIPTTRAWPSGDVRSRALIRSKIVRQKGGDPVATKLCEMTGWTNYGDINALSTAHARAGDFATAVKWASKALELAPEDLKSPYREISTTIDVRPRRRKSPDR